MHKIRKTAFTAYNWEEYSSQGPDYKELELWWRNHATSLPGSYTSDYNSWTLWYWNKYSDKWGRVHRGPADVLEILQAESDGTVAGEAAGLSDGIQERTRRVRDWAAGLFDRGGLSGKLRGGSRDYKGVVKSNTGVNLDGVSDTMKEFLAALGNLAKEKGYHKPHVTSGFRSPRAQIRAMAKNWQRQGGDGSRIVSDSDAHKYARFHGQATVDRLRSVTNKPLNAGLIYLYDLYQNKNMVIGMNDIFLDLGTSRNGVKAGAEYYESLGLAHTGHGSGNAIDLRLQDGETKELLSEVEQSGEFQMSKLEEDDHFHVKVTG